MLFSITWELVRKANSQDHSEFTGSETGVQAQESVLTNHPDYPSECLSLRSTIFFFLFFFFVLATLISVEVPWSGIKPSHSNNHELGTNGRPSAKALEADSLKEACTRKPRKALGGSFSGAGPTCGNRPPQGHTHKSGLWPQLLEEPGKRPLGKHSEKVKEETSKGKSHRRP